MLGKDVLKRKGVHTRKIPIFLNFFLGMNPIMSTLQEKLPTPVALSHSFYFFLHLLHCPLLPIFLSASWPHYEKNFPTLIALSPYSYLFLVPLHCPLIEEREKKRKEQCNGVGKFLSYTTHFFKTSSQFVVLGCTDYLNLQVGLSLFGLLQPKRPNSKYLKFQSNSSPNLRKVRG